MQHIVYVQSTCRVYPKPNLRIKYQQATIKYIHTIPNFLTLVMELMRQEIKKSRGGINLAVYVTTRTTEVRAGVGGS